MTKKDAEMALIQLGEIMQSIVGIYAPNANHISITIVNGTIMVSACEFDGEKSEYIEKDILNAYKFTDGEMYIDGEYIKPGKEDVA